MNIKKSINTLKDKEALLPYLQTEIGNHVDLEDIFIFRENDHLLVADYTLKASGKKINLIGKLRFDGHINTAKAQFMNLSKIEKTIKNKVVIPEKFFYVHTLNALFYKKITGQPLAEIIAEKNNISKINLDKSLAWILKNEKKAFSKNIKLNPQFKPEFFLRQASELAGQHHTQVHQLISKIYQLRISLQLEKAYLCHNDFQPQNIFFEKGQTKTIDFDNVILDDPMVDFTNFYTQIRYGGAIPENKLKKIRQYLFTTYQKKTRLKNDFLERFYLYLAIASVKNLNKHLAENNQEQIAFRLKKIAQALKYFDVEKN